MNRHSLNQIWIPYGEVYEANVSLFFNNVFKKSYALDILFLL